MRLHSIAEATLDDIQRRFPIWVKKYFKGDVDKAKSVIPQLIKADPTRGKYSEWLIRQYVNKNLTAHSVMAISSALKIFDRKKSKLKDRDINNYNPEELIQMLNKPLGLTKSEIKANRKGGMNLPPGAKLIGSRNGIEIIKLTDPKAVINMCSGTKWCTANAESAEEYINNGPLYMVFINGERKFLVEYSTFQVKNIFNDTVDLKEALKVHSTIDKLTDHEYTEDPMMLFYMAQAVEEELPEPYLTTVLQDETWGEEYKNYFDQSLRL